MSSPLRIASLSPPSAAYDDQIVRQPFLFSACVVFLLWMFFTRKKKDNHDLPLPPGPKPLPLVGNLHQLNSAEPWLSYTAWGKKYGDVLHVRLLGQSFVVLNSEKTARELLDQRSALYSDRPVMLMHLSSIFSMDFSTVMLPYGGEWRLHRKLFQYAFRTESEARNREVYLRRVRALLANLLEAPAEFELHIKSYVAANVMGLAYGYEMAPREDPVVGTVMKLVNLLSTALAPERGAILHAFPFLVNLPGWLPGAALWRDAAIAKKLAAEVTDVPFKWVKDQMATGSAPPSLVADCLTQLDCEDDDYGKQEHAIKSTAATVFIAGFETSSSMLHAFVLAMLLYPEVQAKAQAEIDSILRDDRLPHFDDRASIPYVDAIIRELARWNPVLPLGIPHATSGDDVYNGYFIPKGTVIVINAWGMSRDENCFSDTEDFRPERFLSEKGTLKDGPPMSANPVFGLGRRICPGRFASEAFVWAAVVSILATFHIVKAKDAHGNEIHVKKQFTTGLAVRPVEFPCCFIRRSDELVEAIRQSV